VPGTRAALRGNVAAAPAAAPLEVKRAIWAANQLRSKPYRYGGGHRSFHDSGYDCSGTVSFALGAAGVLKSPIPLPDSRSSATAAGENGSQSMRGMATPSRSSPACVSTRLPITRCAVIEPGRRAGNRRTARRAASKRAIRPASSAPPRRVYLHTHGG
jgi:hypothetical protein